MPAEALPQVVGRYSLYGKLASGGMASVHLGRVEGAAGFARTVAIKRLHPIYAEDPEFAAMFVTEARLAARIKHPNVVTTLDVAQEGSELFLVMEYIEGEALSNLVRIAKGAVPIDVGVSIVVGMLHGLHAAHDAKNERGEALNIVHRDVSPQNVMVGADGVPRVLDFGIAKAVGFGAPTRTGQLKGKSGYFAPEQVEGKVITQHVDVFAAGIVLWEVLAGRRLFAADNEAATLARILDLNVPSIAVIRPDVSAAVRAVIARALQRNPGDRYPTAQAMADALEEASPPASPRAIARWVHEMAGPRMAQRAAAVAEVERSGSTSAMIVAPLTSLADVSSAAVVIPKNRAPLFAIGIVGVIVIAVVVVAGTGALHAAKPTAPPRVTADSSNDSLRAASSLPATSSNPSAPIVAATPAAPSPAVAATTSHHAIVHTAATHAGVHHPAHVDVESTAPATSTQPDAGKSLYGRD